MAYLKQAEHVEKKERKMLVNAEIFKDIITTSTTTTTTTTEIDTRD